MSPAVPSAAIFRERMARQGLVSRPGRSVLDACRISAGIQAQDVPAARLAVRSRTQGVSAADVDTATTGVVARTWLMRSTLHWVATADLPWLLRLFGPVVWARHAPVRRQRGITDVMVDASTPIVLDELAAGPRRGTDLSDALARHGIDVPRADNAGAHLFIALAARGVVVRAPDDGRALVFDLAERWCADAPAGPSDDEAVVELVRRYLYAFAPASVEDASAWSGLPIGRLRPVIESLGAQTGEHDAAGRMLHRLDDPPAAVPRTVRLLAGWDSYLMGYRHRSGWLAGGHEKHVIDGGWLHPSVCVDGRLVGRWRLAAGSDTIDIELLPGHRRPALAALRTEVKDIARFLERDLGLGRIMELT